MYIPVLSSVAGSFVNVATRLLTNGLRAIFVSIVPGSSAKPAHLTATGLAFAGPGMISKGCFFIPAGITGTLVLRDSTDNTGDHLITGVTTFSMAAPAGSALRIPLSDIGVVGVLVVNGVHATMTGTGVALTIGVD